MPLDDAEPLIAGLAADHANLRAAHDWFVQTGDTEAELLLAGRLGALWVLLGQCQEGRDWLEQALDRNASASTPGRARALAALTLVAHRLRDFPRTLAAGAEGLALARRVADVSRVGKGPANVAGTLAATGQHALAARLFGASEAYHEVTGYRFGPDAFDRQRALGLPEPWQAAGEPFGTLAPLRAAVEARGTARFPDIPDRALVEVEWAAGRGLAVDDAIALALAAEPVTPAPDPFGTLSTREREVLRMLIDGCPTREIAAALSLSERTVEGHVQHVLDKLGAPSRTAAIVLALRHGFG